MNDIEPVIQLVPLIFMSVLAFWRPHVLLFLLMSGAALMIGLYWYDAYTNETGLTVSLMLIGYSFVSAAFGMKVMLWAGEKD